MAVEISPRDTPFSRKAVSERLTMGSRGRKSWSRRVRAARACAHHGAMGKLPHHGCLNTANRGSCMQLLRHIRSAIAMVALWTLTFVPALLIPLLAR